MAVLWEAQLVRLPQTHTHTDRYLHFKSHHDKKHKIRTAATLLHRVTRLPKTVEGKAIETKNVVEALKSNGHPTKFIADVQRRQKETKVTPESEELVREFCALIDRPTTPSGYAVLPNIKSLTEPLARVLRKRNIKVCKNKPTRTLQEEIQTSPEDRSGLKPKSRPT